MTVPPVPGHVYRPLEMDRLVMLPSARTVIAWRWDIVLRYVSGYVAQDHIYVPIDAQKLKFSQLLLFLDLAASVRGQPVRYSCLDRPLRGARKRLCLWLPIRAWSLRCA